MELTLAIVLVIGTLLFLYSYLRYIFAGFRYHPITGLLAIIPVINLVTFPTLMDKKITRALIIGVIGLILAAGAWFLGGDRSLHNYLLMLRGSPTASAPAQVAKSQAHQGQIQSAKPVATQSNASDNQSVAPVTPQASTPVAMIPALPTNVYQQELPKKALYSLKYQTVSIDQISTLVGRIVRVTTSQDEVFEGRISKLGQGSVFINHQGDANVAYEHLIGNISRLEVMVRR